MSGKSKWCVQNILVGGELPATRGIQEKKGVARPCRTYLKIMLTYHIAD